MKGPLKGITAVAAALAVAGIVAGCGGSSSGGSTSSSASAGKSPIVIGAIVQEAGSSSTFPEATVAWKAAVSYVNAQGGAGGHPLKLDVCVTDDTPASSQQCADKMVEDGVEFVTHRDYNMAAAYPVLQSAHIPVIGGTPVSNEDFTSPDAHYFNPGSAAGIPSEIVYIQKYLPKVRQVGVVLPGIPATLAALPLLEKPLKALGIKTTIAKLPATGENFLGSYSALEPSKQGVIIGLLPEEACIGLAKAAQQVGAKTQILTSYTCTSSQIYKQVGNALNGWLIWTYGPDPEGSTPDARLYQQAMHKYAGPSANLSGAAPSAFADIMTIYNNLLKPLGSQATNRAAVLKKLMSPAGGQVFLGPHYQCGVKSPYPTICNFDMMVFKIKDQKLAEPTEFLNTLPLIKRYLG